MTLRELIADLLGQANERQPTARELRERFAPAARGVSTAGPGLKRPAWARSVNGADDVFLDLDGEVAGLQLSEDDRGLGAYAEVAVIRGTLADVEALVGPTDPLPRAPGGGAAKVSAYVKRGDRTIRVFVELAKAGPEISKVTVHFQR